MTVIWPGAWFGKTSSVLEGEDFFPSIVKLSKSFFVVGIVI